MALRSKGKPLVLFMYFVACVCVLGENTLPLRQAFTNRFQLGLIVCALSHAVSSVCTVMSAGMLRDQKLPRVVFFPFLLHHIIRYAESSVIKSQIISNLPERLTWHVQSLQVP